MSDHPDRDHAEVRSRLVGFIELDDDTHISVDHVYDNGVCPEHGGLASPGMVGLTVLDAAAALLVQNRIGRAVNLVLELDESLPDVEREVLRHSEPHGAG